MHASNPTNSWFTKSLLDYNSVTDNMWLDSSLSVVLLLRENIDKIRIVSLKVGPVTMHAFLLYNMSDHYFKCQTKITCGLSSCQVTSKQLQCLYMQSRSHQTLSGQVDIVVHNMHSILQGHRNWPGRPGNCWTKDSCSYIKRAHNKPEPNMLKIYQLFLPALPKSVPIILILFPYYAFALMFQVRIDI